MNFFQKNMMVLIVSAVLLMAAVFGIAYLFSDDTESQLANIKGDILPATRLPPVTNSPRRNTGNDTRGITPKPISTSMRCPFS